MRLSAGVQSKVRDITPVCGYNRIYPLPKSLIMQLNICGIEDLNLAEKNCWVQCFASMFPRPPMEGKIYFRYLQCSFCGCIALHFIQLLNTYFSCIENNKNQYIVIRLILIKQRILFGLYISYDSKLQPRVQRVTDLLERMRQRNPPTEWSSASDVADAYHIWLWFFGFCQCQRV